MYYRRHLTDLEDTNTKLFFQIIMEAAAVNFEQPKVEERTRSLVSELEAMPHHFQEQQELVPYQKLWQMTNLVHAQ